MQKCVKNTTERSIRRHYRKTKLANEQYELCRIDVIKEKYGAWESRVQKAIIQSYALCPKWQVQVHQFSWEKVAQLLDNETMPKVERHIFSDKGTNRYLFFQLFFWFADPGHFRVSVYHGGYAVIVNVNRSPSHPFYAKNAFILSFVGQHRSSNYITNSIDAIRPMKQNKTLFKNILAHPGYLM